jgi:hypothetical protein
MFHEAFFSTLQFVFAVNDSEGLRYGAIQAIFLTAAARLVAHGHRDQSGGQRWQQVAIAEVLPVLQAQCLLNLGTLHYSIQRQN